MCKVETCILAFSGVEGIYPFRTCESCLQPTGEWYQQHPRRQGREGREEDPLVKRRLLENWGRLLGHSSFRQRRKDRTGRRRSRKLRPSQRPLTFHSRNCTDAPAPSHWAPCTAHCSMRETLDSLSPSPHLPDSPLVSIYLH